MKPSIISVYHKAEITTGAHKRHIGLLEKLNNRGYEILLFSPVNFLGQHISYYKIAEPKKSLTPVSIQTLFSLRKQFKVVKDHLSAAQIILVFGFNQIFASLYLKRRLNIPLVFIVRSNMYEYRRIKLTKRGKEGLKSIYNKIRNYLYLSLFQKVENYVYKKSDLLIVQNEDDYRSLTNSYNLDEKKIRIIRNNLNFFGSDTSSHQNNSLSLNSVLFVGTLSKRKGIMLLLKAIKDLKRDKVDIKLDILGDGELLNEVLKFVKLNNMGDAVSVHGFIDDPLQYIAATDLLVMPSLVDSFPNSVLEALYVGTPVIGSDTGGISEILEYDSLLFEPNSHIAIKDKIKSLLDIKRYAKCKRDCSQRREKFIFDWTGEFEKVISQTIN